MGMRRFVKWECDRCDNHRMLEHERERLPDGWLQVWYSRNSGIVIAGGEGMPQLLLCDECSQWLTAGKQHHVRKKPMGKPASVAVSSGEGDRAGAGVRLSPKKEVET